MKMDHETIARRTHRRGIGCSQSVYSSFKDINKHSSGAPVPRSEGGKCGAVLAGEKVLREMGTGQIELFEKRFKEKFGTLKCFELLNSGYDCNDFVGEAAAIVDALISDEM